MGSLVPFAGWSECVQCFFSELEKRKRFESEVEVKVLYS